MKFSLFLFLISSICFAASETNQYLPGQKVETYDLEKDTEEAADAAYLPGSYSNFYESKPAEDSQKTEIKQNLPGTMKQGSSITSYKNAKILAPLHNSGSTLMSFAFHLNTYDWADGRGRYDKIFKESTGHMTPGSLLLGFQSYMFRSGINGTYGLNFGLGYSRGRAYFVTGEPSETMFTLWQFPLELALGLELPISRYFKLYAEGGPAALALMQNRNDRSAGEDGKSIRQIGYGYFAKAKLGISLSSFFGSYGHGLYSRYNISNSHLTLELKMIKIDHFKEASIGVAGASFGLGFSFEYL